MSKTEAERKIMDGWTRELEKAESERLFALFSDELFMHMLQLSLGKKPLGLDRDV